ncbi:MAG: GGDEF domain-containing protein [Firmicutes bacterium]|nr:GGDEF domain-containing protein [Bacillota bacterium]
MSYYYNQLIVKIDTATKITQVISNTFSDLSVSIGDSIIHVFMEDSLHTFCDNFSKAQKDSSSVGFSLQFSNGINAYMFLVNHETEMTVFSVASSDQASQMFDEIMLVNSEHINSIRALYKKLFKAEDNMMFFEEIMKINNSLINLKRELANKNKELERLNKELENINYIDYLTKTSNRRKFFVDIYKLVEQENYLLTMMDFNHFKAINDEFGHKRGDEALIYFANALQDELKIFDGLVYRLGGDEFAFLVTESVSLNREKLFEEIDKELKQFHHLTSISHGTVLVTSKNCNEKNKAELSMAEADRLMYDMKKEYYRKNELNFSGK